MLFCWQTLNSLETLMPAVAEFYKLLPWRQINSPPPPSSSPLLGEWEWHTLPLNTNWETLVSTGSFLLNQEGGIRRVRGKKNNLNPRAMKVEANAWTMGFPAPINHCLVDKRLRSSSTWISACTPSLIFSNTKARTRTITALVLTLQLHLLWKTPQDLFVV